MGMAQIFSESVTRKVLIFSAFYNIYGTLVFMFPGVLGGLGRAACACAVHLFLVCGLEHFAVRFCGGMAVAPPPD